MKIQLVVFLTAAIAFPAFAHDPSQHKPGDAKDPDCTQMEKMDMSKMDPNDPVMKAMHEKCMDAMTHEHQGHDQKSAVPAKPKTDKSDADSHTNHNAQ
jgi:hypothetical protein